MSYSGVILSIFNYCYSNAIQQVKDTLKSLYEKHENDSELNPNYVCIENCFYLNIFGAFRDELEDKLNDLGIEFVLFYNKISNGSSLIADKNIDINKINDIKKNLNLL